MRKQIVTVALLSMLILAVMTGCGVLQEPAAPSEPIEAVPLAAETPVVDAAAASETTGDVVTFQISPADSQVRFELDEDLRGNRFTVVGVTDQIAGELALDFADLSTAQVGVIRINARTLATDNDFRNRAIQNNILETGDYEFISFAPTAVSGLSGSVTVGEAVSFSITGDLTIRDITHEVTFEVTATAVSDTQITGTATATVLRSDYDLNIPEVPNVANVEEEVDLTIDFVANS
ncbi:MAG: YceI family protein [Ardenticatenaceae bacterium]|nr:YceI family protein [Ardenticatenaceae bacterium]MCB8991563.1 YceI family protein [Ardenticatenaceae bacterium]